MKSKKFVVIMLIIAFVLLLLLATLNYVVDPLFLYHTPWFGMEPIITNERYQNAGIAKNFEFDNVLLGNSMSENFFILDLNDTFGGHTVKLTAAGSFSIDYTYTLNILKNRKAHPKYIICNFDQSSISVSPVELKHPLPVFLYDHCFINDALYLLNWSITKEYTIETITQNINGSVPDYNTAFVWAFDYDFGKDIVLSDYERPEKSEIEPDIESFVENAIANIDLLTPYFEAMPDTEFVFFHSPYSMAFWDKATRTNYVEARKTATLRICDIMTKYENVSYYFWTDKEMLNTISNLNNYKDTEHYSPEINKEILRRIKAGEGLLTRENYKEEIDKFFDYIYSFDYDSLFE